MGLTPEEVRTVLDRAQEIERGASSEGTDPQLLIEAGAEVGISETAIRRALRELATAQPEPPTPGDLVFAQTPDGKFRVAEVEERLEEDFQVRFIGGAGGTVSLHELRPCSLVPGARVVVRWPGWGPWTSTVVSYDEDKRLVQVADGWGSTLQVSIGEIWLKDQKPTGLRRIRAHAALVGIGATAGAIIGSVVTALLLG